MVKLYCGARIVKKIAKILEKYKHNITKKEKEYFINFSSNISNVYGLPKIQKSKLIQNIIRKQQKKKYVNISEQVIIVISQCYCYRTCYWRDLKLRLIGAGPIFPTIPLSYLNDILSKPSLLHVKS